MGSPYNHSLLILGKLTEPVQGQQVLWEGSKKHITEEGMVWGSSWGKCLQQRELAAKTPFLLDL